MMYHSGNFKFSHLALREKSAENTLTDFLYWDVEPGVPVALAKFVDCPPTVRARLARPLCLVVGRGHGSDHDAVLPELKELLPLHDIGKLDGFRSQAKNRISVGLFYRELYSILTDSLRTMFITTTYHTTTIC